MTWLVWRRRRATVALAAGFVALVAVLLTLGRLLIALPPTGGICPAGSDLSCTASLFWGAGHFAMMLAPLLVGLIAGTGLFSRDVDRGTHVFALTQNVGRGTWWASGLAQGVAATVVATAAITLVAGWAFALVEARTGGSPLAAPKFEVAGIVPIGYALLAFTLTAVAGLLSRNASTGVVVAILGYGVVMFLLATTFRAQYLPVETLVAPNWDSLDVPQGDWAIRYDYLDSAGRSIPAYEVYGNCVSNDDQCLARAGVVHVAASVHPASRYWPFQLIETGILLLLSAGTVAVGTVRLRRATAP